MVSDRESPLSRSALSVTISHTSFAIWAASGVHRTLASLAPSYRVAQSGAPPNQLAFDATLSDLSPNSPTRWGQSDMHGPCHQQQGCQVPSRCQLIARYTGQAYRVFCMSCKLAAAAAVAVSCDEPGLARPHTLAQAMVTTAIYRCGGAAAVRPVPRLCGRERGPAAWDGLRFESSRTRELLRSLVALAWGRYEPGQSRKFACRQAAMHTACCIQEWVPSSVFRGTVARPHAPALPRDECGGVKAFWTLRNEAATAFSTISRNSAPAHVSPRLHPVRLRKGCFFSPLLGVRNFERDNIPPSQMDWRAG